MPAHRIPRIPARIGGPVVTLLIVVLGAFFLLVCPGSSALAFTVGRLDVAPRLDLEGMYDDNVWLRESGDPERPVVGDWVCRVRPGLLLRYDYGATDFSLGYRTSFDFYMGRKSPSAPEVLDTTRQDSYARDHDVSLSARRAFTPRTSVAVTDTLRIGTDVSDLVEALPGEVPDGVTGTLPDPADYRINRVGVTVTHRLTRTFSLVGGGGYRYAWYDETERDGEALRPVREEHHGDATAGFTYAWHARNTLDVNVVGSYMDYGRRGESKGVALTAGNAWQATEALSMSGRVGVQYLDQLDRFSEDGILVQIRSKNVRPTGDAALSYAFREFVFTLAGNAGVSEGSGAGTTRWSRAARLTVSYEPRTALTLNGFAGYAKDEALSADDREDTESYQAGAGIAYRFRPWFGAGFRYTFIDRNALGERGTSYKVNRFVLGVNLSLPDSLG